MARRKRLIVEVTIPTHDTWSDDQILRAAQRRLETLGDNVTVTIDETVQYPNK